MNPIFLVAMRDYRQVAATRSFRITLLFLPLIFVLAFMAQSFLRPPASNAYMLMDASHSYGALIDRRIELDYQRQVLGNLAVYVQRWNVGEADQDAVWSEPQDWYSDAEVMSFMAQGGAAAALGRIRPLLPAGAPAFAAVARPFVKLAPPGVSEDQSVDSFRAAISPYLQGRAVPGKPPLALAIYIPKDFGKPDVAVRLWPNGRASAPLIGTVREELTQALKSRAFAAHGLASGDAAQIEAMSAPLDISQPPAGTGRAQIFVRSLVPLAMAYLLLIAALITGGMMLQGVIEERSNRLLESVLACIRPTQLMAGKLLGLGAIGLTVMAVWLGCALAAAYFMPGVMADVLRPSLATLQPWMVAAMVFYFFAGYLIVSMAFLAIGSISNSMQDAQAYLMPVMMSLMLPVMLMVGSLFSNPDGPLPRIMSWIPVYTPFAMLARLGGGVSLGELLGTGVLLIGFVTLELFALGRVFQANLLNTGQPPRLAAVVKLMLHPPGDR